jgi:hypothetical protein
LSDGANTELRLSLLESSVKQMGQEVDDHGGAIDHLVNTVDSVILPTLKNHSDVIAVHDAHTQEAHDWIVSQKGAWQLIQRAGIVIAAICGVATMIKLFTSVAKP